MTHPAYPLALEERIEIVTAPNDPAVISKIQQTFAHRRNMEFPGWARKYAKEVRQWLALHSKPNRSA